MEAVVISWANQFTAGKPHTRDISLRESDKQIRLVTCLHHAPDVSSHGVISSSFLILPQLPDGIIIPFDPLT